MDRRIVVAYNAGNEARDALALAAGSRGRTARGSW
jgi:hypothetical protein